MHQRKRPKPDVKSQLKDALARIEALESRLSGDNTSSGPQSTDEAKVTSKAQDVTFGKITCRELTVVDDEGNPSVVLSIDPHGGVVGVISKDGNYGVQSSNNDNGGAVVAFGKDGKGAASLYNNEHGGAVKAYGKDGGQAQFGNDEYGGAMALFDKGGNRTGRLP